MIRAQRHKKLGHLNVRAFGVTKHMHRSCPVWFLQYTFGAKAFLRSTSTGEPVVSVTQKTDFEMFSKPVFCYCIMEQSNILLRPR